MTGISPILEMGKNFRGLAAFRRPLFQRLAFRFGERRTARQASSNVDLLRDTQRIFQFDTEITHGTIDLRMAE